MPIEPFKIVNDDGTTNISEYNRCVAFLEDYVAGTVKIYPELTWSNPFEVDLTQEKSAYTILRDVLFQNTNRLLNKVNFDNVKKLFTGILQRYGSTIHTFGRYLEESKNFLDGPGYSYDVFSKDETKVLKDKLNDDCTVYYLDDENHTVLEYNDTQYSLLNNSNLPIYNIPVSNFDTNNLVSNTNSPSVYKGNLCGIYSDFQRLTGQYTGSSTLFYYSECNDILYTTGGNSYEDDRLSQVVNFKFNSNVSDKSKPTRGIELSKVTSSRDALVDEAFVNSYINPSVVNPTINYLSPTFFTAKNQDDWKI